MPGGYLGKSVAPRVLTGSDIATNSVAGSNLAIGSVPGFSSVTSGTTALGVTHVGLIKVDATGGNVILNLPAANLQTNPVLRYMFRRTDSTANSVTINRAGSDTIKFGVTSVTSFTLATNGDGLILMADGTSAWYGDGVAALTYSPEFAYSHGPAGYQKLPSGLIIQWGLVATGGAADSTASFTLTYPTACYSVTATPGVSNNLTVNIQSVTTSGFNYYRRVGQTAAAETSQFYWMAIGK